MTFLSNSYQFFSKPWLHFVLLGIILNDISGRIFPPSAPVIGPLSTERISTLQRQWMDVTRTVPTPLQLKSMIKSELDRDMMFHFALSKELHLHDPVVYQRLLRNMSFLDLSRGKPKEQVYKEAIDMRMHLGDEVIKRRMIQVVEQILVARNPPDPPSEKQISETFDGRKKEFQRPNKYTLQHLYFPQRKSSNLSSAMNVIKTENMTPEEARKLSFPFLPGYKFVRQSGEQLSRRFGYEFTKNLQALDLSPNKWFGPIGSTYGQHLVWIDEIELARDAVLSEVRSELVRDLERNAYKDALAAELDKLRMKYEYIQ